MKAVEQIPSGVAVIADIFGPRNSAAKNSRSTWDFGSKRRICPRKKCCDDFAERSQMPGAIAKKTGDPEAALKSAAKTITAEYDVPYLAHACMEPLNCVVDLRGRFLRNLDRHAV